MAEDVKIFHGQHAANVDVELSFLRTINVANPHMFYGAMNENELRSFTTFQIGDIDRHIVPICYGCNRCWFRSVQIGCLESINDGRRTV